MANHARALAVNLLLGQVLDLLFYGESYIFSAYDGP